MSLDPNVPAFSEQMVDIYVDGTETQTGRLMIGFGVNSDAGVVGNVVVDERNFDWTRIPTSWEDVRHGAALRGAGQRFRIDASPGSSVNRYLVSFQEPYLFDRPISLGLSGSYFDRNYADWDEQRSSAAESRSATNGSSAIVGDASVPRRERQNLQSLRARGRRPAA